LKLFGVNPLIVNHQVLKAVKEEKKKWKE